MNRLLIALLLAVCVTTAQATVLDNRSYGTSIASCEVVSLRVSSDRAFQGLQQVGYDMFKQLKRGEKSFKGQDRSDFAHAYSRVSQRVGQASVPELTRDLETCARWMDGN